MVKNKKRDERISSHMKDKTYKASKISPARDRSLSVLGLSDTNKNKELNILIN